MVIAAINFTRTTIEIVKSSKRLDTVKDEISLLEQEKVDLEKSIEYKKSEEFIETTARNELNMAKAGESVYVISGLSKNETVSKVDGSAVIVSAKGPTRTDPMKNLAQWFHLLF